jgi:quercetin dioxygenase-like cupin family protein
MNSMIVQTKAAATLNLHLLAPIIEHMRTDHPLEHFGRNTRTIHREPGLSVLLVVMQSGAFLNEHKAPGALTVQVLEGRIAFFSEGQQVEAGPFELITLAAHAPHKLEALEASALLLTIAGNT